MQTLSDSIEIDVQPARVWEWLDGFTIATQAGAVVFYGLDP